MIIAIWGMSASGKSSLADAIGAMDSQHHLTAVIDTDLCMPTLPLRIGGLRAGAAQDGLDPGKDLFHFKGLGNIVVSAYVQTQHLVLRFGFRGEQNDRRIGKFPNFRSCCNAVHLGHHHIQQE